MKIIIVKYAGAIECVVAVNDEAVESTVERFRLATHNEDVSFSIHNADNVIDTLSYIEST